jgi:hypothetical protein
MNIAILFCGISYTESGTHRRDFRKTIYTHNRFIKKLEQHHSVQVYTCTYDSPMNDQLIKSYKPVDYVIIDFFNSHQRLTFLAGLDLIKRNSSNIDFVITLRFDMKLKKDFLNKIKPTKFNLLFREKSMWDSHNYVCDNFFAFPYKQLDSLYYSIELIHSNFNFKYSFMHHIYEPIKNKLGEHSINFICNKKFNSDKNPYYILYRVKDSFFRRLKNKFYEKNFSRCIFNSNKDIK